MRLLQSETYYPIYQEGHSGVTAVAVGICRLTDGFWLDWNDSTFKNSGWTTQYQALAEDENGLWVYATGWAIPNANSIYKAQWKVTDASGTFYAEGPDVIVNDAIMDAIFDRPASIGISFETLIERIYQLLQGKVSIVDATGAATLRNIGDSANLATWTITDDDTTTIKTEASWV